MSAGEVDLAVLGVGQLGALLLRAHAGQPAHAVTQTQLPLVLTTRVWKHYTTRDMTRDMTRDWWPARPLRNESLLRAFLTR